jgi:hypothetical protein
MTESSCSESLFVTFVIVILSPIAYLKKFVRKIAKSTSHQIREAGVKIYYIVYT